MIQNKTKSKILRHNRFRWVNGEEQKEAEIREDERRGVGSSPEGKIILGDVCEELEWLSYPSLIQIYIIPVRS